LGGQNTAIDVEPPEVMRSLGLAASEAQLREFRAEAEKKDLTCPASYEWRLHKPTNTVGR
jgi:hypothetical protein